MALNFRSVSASLVSASADPDTIFLDKPASEQDDNFVVADAPFVMEGCRSGSKTIRIDAVRDKSDRAVIPNGQRSIDEFLAGSEHVCDV